jgi:hypothetical protein
MAKVEIYGSSDDLIEIDGDISEEFYALSEDDGGLLAFSDGTLLRIAYDNDGMWRISPVLVGSAIYEMVQATDPDDDYSDHAWLTGDIEWVVLGSKYAKAKL